MIRTRESRLSSRAGLPPTVGIDIAAANPTRVAHPLLFTLALRAAGKKPVATPHARSGRAGRVTFSGALETQSISLWAASHSWLGHAPIGSTDIAAAGSALAKTS